MANDQSTTTTKLCACGCGGETPIATHTRRGYTKGERCNFIAGHNRMNLSISMTRYRATGDPRKRAHVAIAERVLGHPLPPGAIVHHVDGNRHNNATSNLAILPSRAYHVSLHARLRVLSAGGNPHTDALCSYCQLTKPFTDFYQRRDRTRCDSRCKSCSHLLYLATR